jgi:hypothetical protein
MKTRLQISIKQMSAGWGCREAEANGREKEALALLGSQLTAIYEGLGDSPGQCTPALLSSTDKAQVAAQQAWAINSGVHMAALHSGEIHFFITLPMLGAQVSAQWGS